MSIIVNSCCFFFFNDTATTEIYTLSLHDALPISCQAYTVERPNTPYGYEEINNCPNLSGEFSNTNWRVSLQKWEPAAYLYRGFNRQTSDQIQLIDFDVVGTTDRPQYRFHNGDTTYTVSFQTADPDTIRLQVYQLDQLVVNELLYR